MEMHIDSCRDQNPYLAPLKYVKQNDDFMELIACFHP